MARNRFSARLTGESPRQFSLWERISPSLGNWLIACSITGNHDCCKNPTTAAAARRAHTNCTSSNRFHDARAKAATPRGVNGCHALCDFSTEASTLKRSNRVREPWEDYSARNPKLPPFAVLFGVLISSTFGFRVSDFERVVLL